MKKIVIVAAMDVEFDAIDACLTLKLESEKLAKIAHGQVGKCEVWLVKSNAAGKVATAMTTQYMIDLVVPDIILDVGIAGALANSLKIGDVIIGARFVQHDVIGAPHVGRKRGEVPLAREASFPNATPEIVAALTKAAQVSKKSRVHIGTIASGDEGIFDEKHKSEIIADFPKLSPIAVDMESAAFAFVAAQNNIAFSVVRVISDTATKSEAPRVAGENALANGSAQIVAKIVAAFLYAES